MRHSRFQASVIAGWFLISAAAGTASDPSATSGTLEGHLTIVSRRTVELSDEGASPQPNVPNYSDYPLVVRSRDGKQEIAQVSVDPNGNYRIALPPGDYMLDGQCRRHLRVQPKPFTVTSDKTVRVDLNIDPGVR